MQELHMKSKVFSLHGKMEILDNDDQEVYTVSSKVISIHNKTYIYNTKGDQIAFISRRPISLHEVHTIEMNDGTTFKLSTEWFHLFQDVIDIKELGWHLHGDFFEHNYEIWDEKGKTLATTHLKWFSIHRYTYIDILDDTKQDIIIALFVALERIIEDRAAADSDTPNNTTNNAPSGNNQ